MSAPCCVSTDPLRRVHGCPAAEPVPAFARVPCSIARIVRSPVLIADVLNKTLSPWTATTIKSTASIARLACSIETSRLRSHSMRHPSRVTRYQYFLPDERSRPDSRCRHEIVARRHLWHGAQILPSPLPLICAVTAYGPRHAARHDPRHARGPSARRARREHARFRAAHVTVNSHLP
jgi:hypothetical protein